MPSLDLVLKNLRSQPVQEIAKRLTKSSDYVLGIVEGSKEQYKVIDDVVVRKNLGVDLCIVCIEPVNERDVMKVEIPKEVLGNKKLDYSLRGGVKGHTRCYETEGIIARFEGLSCYNCTSLSGTNFPEQGVEDRCNRFGQSGFGRYGEISAHKSCQFFSPDDRVMEDRDKTALLSLQTRMNEQKIEGYHKLVTMLESAKLVK